MSMKQTISICYLLILVLGVSSFSSSSFAISGPLKPNRRLSAISIPPPPSVWSYSSSIWALLPLPISLSPSPPLTRLFGEGPQDPSTAAAYTPSPSKAPLQRGPDVKALASLIIGEVVLGLVSIPLGHLMGVNPLATLSFKTLAQSLKLGFLLTLPVLILHKASGKTIDEMLKDSLDEIFGNLLIRKALIIIISIILSLSAGIGEELLFRGAIQPMMANVLGNQYLAIALSSIIFGGLHAATTRYLLLASILSGYLGFLQVKFNNLLIPIVVHTLFDIFAFLKYLYIDSAQRKGISP